MITSAAELTIATDTSFSFTEQHLQLQPTLCRTQWILRRKTKVSERSGRLMDHEEEDVFEKLRSKGYM